MTKKVNTGVKVSKIEGHSFFTKNLTSRSVLVDLGVNEGNFSRNLISTYNLKSYGVEAEGHIYRKFLTGKDNLFVLNAAITDYNGEISINRVEGLCSTTLNTNLHETTYDSVEAITFDKFTSFFKLDVIDLIKFDIEGSEIAVFSNCSDEQILRWKQITIEFHDFIFPELRKDVSRIQDRLKRLGFHEVRFSLDNTDVVYLNKNYFRISLPSILFTLLIFRYLRGMKRRYTRSRADKS
jgi:FkbM family methyltransferase